MVEAITRGAERLAEATRGVGMVHRLISPRDHGVILEDHADMPLAPPHSHHAVLTKGEDIVTHGIVDAVVLIEAVGATVDNGVALDRDVGRALIGIDAVATVMTADHIMNVVVLDHRAALHTEQINARHIRKQTDTDMMDMVTPYDITVGI